MVVRHKALALLAISLKIAYVASFHSALPIARAPVSSDRTRITLSAYNTEGNGDGAGEDGPSGGMMSMKSLQTQLASAFSALDESDQYDAVLTGLCAKLLDKTSLAEGEEPATMEDPMRLVDEMNSRRVRASPRSLMSFIDAAVTMQDAKLMSTVMSLSARNGGINQYGVLQTQITPLPPNPSTRVRCPDGSTRSRADRLASLPEVPTDDRSSEVSSALAVAGVVGFCGAVNVLGLDGISPFTTLVWFLIVIVGLTDNFYDLLKFGAKMAGQDQLGNLPKELPLGLGSGAVTGKVVKGFNRLLKVDTERESECEAAAFFVAYTLGLPVFSFRPNALEAAVLAAESDQRTNELDSLLTSNGIMKILVWLMAPVAMESLKYPQLIQSDPREAEGFLMRLERSDLIDRSILWWLDGLPGEKEDMLKWAYTEADLLIRRNDAIVIEIAQRLTGGAATVGDCVAAVEGW